MGGAPRKAQGSTAEQYVISCGERLGLEFVEL